MPSLLAFRRSAWLWLPVLLALLARVAVAPGWMVERDAGGTITVRICSDMNNPGQTTQINIERTADDHAVDDSQHCPWGALASGAVLPDIPIPDGRLIKPSAPPSGMAALGFAPGVASPLPPSTGPPSFA
jgi:hypothetical protein